MRRSRRAEFEWRPVYAALGPADLSGRVGDEPDSRPAWPTRRYEEIFKELDSCLLAPPQSLRLTVADLERACDLLIDELGLKAPADANEARRWLKAHEALSEAKRRAKATHHGPRLFER